jgi:hypothetical protein
VALASFSISRGIRRRIHVNVIEIECNVIEDFQHVQLIACLVAIAIFTVRNHSNSTLNRIVI